MLCNQDTMLLLVQGFVTVSAALLSIVLCNKKKAPAPAAAAKPTAAAAPPAAAAAPVAGQKTDVPAKTEGTQASDAKADAKKEEAKKVEGKG
ncbi:hypothetical protein QR680_007341 [Steinernema hermaphroditum]|uniref:Uncharacterized protein n=1 Tax=Steinernema hermaphroditum TaxID=289476 RepID=A0AA39M697_9BILA|nr:hypothetical protein QR680_007341 [Steinernema hermaphroditum]